MDPGLILICIAVFIVAFIMSCDTYQQSCDLQRDESNV